jgi:hypothetical protein
VNPNSKSKTNSPKDINSNRQSSGSRCRYSIDDVNSVDAISALLLAITLKPMAMPRSKLVASLELKRFSTWHRATVPVALILYG